MTYVNQTKYIYICIYIYIYIDIYVRRYGVWNFVEFFKISMRNFSPFNDANLLSKKRVS